MCSSFRTQEVPAQKIRQSPVNGFGLPHGVQKGNTATATAKDRGFDLQDGGRAYRMRNHSPKVTGMSGEFQLSTTPRTTTAKHTAREHPVGPCKRLKQLGSQA